LLTSVGALSIITLMGTTVVVRSMADERSARVSQSRTTATSLAEAGINEAMSVLAKPGNNPLNPSLLSPRTSTYEGGSVTWSGMLDAATSTWTLTSTGKTRNPTGAAELVRTITAQAPVTVTVTGSLASPAWNYIYAGATESACDMTIQQSVQVASPLYVRGDLCLQNSATITSGPLQVHGRLTMYQNGNAVGSLTAPISEAHIADGCVWKASTLHLPCSIQDNVFATVTDSSPADIPPPTVSWDTWYLHASPGPHSPCAAVSGMPPAFDNDQGTSPDAAKRNNSLTSSFSLTPSLSYVCRTAGGELSWDAFAKKLTLRGTVFIDGSARIENGFVNSYDGQAALYLSGTLLLRNSHLCAVAAGNGSGCANSGWNPNTRLLVVAANGTGGQVPGGDSIQLVSSTFQGALYGTGAIEIDTTSQAIGPMIGSTVMLGQSVTTSFPAISIVPAGSPGQTPVLASVGAPRSYG
jgi:hypothetical protein